MITPRETIYAALFALVSQSAGYVTASRYLLHWNDVPAESRPAIFQREVSEAVVRTRGVPSQITLNVELYIYVQTNAQLVSGVVPSSLMNPLLDALDTALAPTGGDLQNQTQTLGGLVSHCWINGTTEIFEGFLADQAVAIVPISILVPA